MNARTSGLFNFSRKGGDASAAAATQTAEKPHTSEQTASAPDSAKTALADFIAEMAKPEPRTSAPRTARQERRHRRRVRISAPVRVRQVDVRQATEFDLTMTADVSREGILFETSRATYQRGQEVAVVFPYRAMVPGEHTKEQRGQVVRVVRASENRFGVAVAFIAGEPKLEFVDSLGNPLGYDSTREHRSDTFSPAKAPQQKPLIIHVDADAHIRAMVRAEMEAQGYLVESLEDPNLALAVLRHREPAALITEAEPFAGALPGGGEMSGYDLCVIVRRNAKLARVPVILTTRTGLPSDFATAHALGATVCVSKPYDLKRIMHLVRMLTFSEA
ncbi:MAG TPA: PilZ domain-containing protein [Candidatus Acidoferrales bacterium]|nr:PilZ domain-containing protein [Candidatus Acidoferrales bacterium]